MDGGEEISGGFVIACSDGAELFEFGKEVFNQVACFVEFFVVGSRLKAFGAWRNHSLFSSLAQRFKHSGLGIEALVGDDDSGLKLRQQNVGSVQLASLPAGQMHAGWVAQSVHGHVDLGT